MLVRRSGTQDEHLAWRPRNRSFPDPTPSVPPRATRRAPEGAVRSKGSLYFNIHQHGRRATGRWVGLSHDGPLISGWAAVARTENEVLDLLNELRGGNA